MRYSVRSGESPSIIARRFGLPMSSLVAANPHKPTKVVAGARTWVSLRVGEALNVPGGGTVGDYLGAYAPGSITGPHATIRKGSTGTDVATWQAFLGITADGIFGSGTDTATRNFQKSRGLTADGIVGPNTWAAAQGAITSQAQAATQLFATRAVVPTTRSTAPADPAASHALIKQGSSGPDVALWQTIIGVTADGVFGSGTDAATRKWQSAHGVAADGVVGPNTWKAALGGAYASAAAPAAASTSSVSASAAVATAALRADPNYCASVKKTGTPVNSGVHNFKAAWNAANPRSPVPINTGNYEPVVAQALSSALGGASVPPGCGAAGAAPAAVPMPSVTPVSTSASPVAAQALTSVDPCYSGNAAMVCAAQSALGLTADGKYGAGTAAALRRFFPNAPAPCSPAPLWWGKAGENKCGGAAVTPSTPPSVFTPPPTPETTTSAGWQVTPPSTSTTPTTTPGVTPVTDTTPGGATTATSTTTITPGGPAQPAVAPPDDKKISTGALVAGGLGIAALVGVVAIAASGKKGAHGKRGPRGKPAHKPTHHKTTRKKR